MQQLDCMGKNIQQKLLRHKHRPLECAMALARVAAQCSIAYGAFMQAAAPVLAAGTLDQARGFSNSPN